MWVKCFRADGERYIYSGWSNEIRRADARLYEFFSHPARGPASEEARRTAVRLGLLPQRPIRLEVFTARAVREELGRLQREGPSRMVLTVTEACNFRCRYCVFSGAYRHARQHSTHRMPAETALAALAWYLGFAREEYLIGFYGGEPLLEFGLIRRIVREAKQRLRPGARLAFSVTTNGWLLDDERTGFLAENGFDLFVSLDGPAAVHDRYRRTAGGRPTFSRVWERIQFMRHRYPDYFADHVNFCVMLAPPDRLAEVTGFVAEHTEVFGGKVPVVLALDDPPRALLADMGIGPGEERIHLGALRERYVAAAAAGCRPDGLARGACEAALAAIARRSVSALPALRISGGQCFPGARCHVAPDGTMHICERAGADFPIGHVRTGYGEGQITSLLARYAKMVRERCRDCWAVRLCRKCVVDLAAGRRLSQDRMAAVCVHRRTELARDLADHCRIAAAASSLPAAAL